MPCPAVKTDDADDAIGSTKNSKTSYSRYHTKSRIQNKQFTGFPAVLPILISCRRIGRWAQSDDRSSRLLHLESKCGKNWLLTVPQMPSTPSGTSSCPTGSGTPERGWGDEGAHGSASNLPGLPFYRRPFLRLARPPSYLH